MSGVGSSVLCDACGHSCANTRGLKIHKAKMHNKDKRKPAVGSVLKGKRPKKSQKVEARTPDPSSSSSSDREEAVVKPRKKGKDEEKKPNEAKLPAREKKAKSPVKEAKSPSREKAKSPVKKKNMFKEGNLLEGENNDPDLPLYLDTIHEVEYVSPSGEDTHRCRMVAFHGRPIYE